jgi:hypothetical protein
MMTLASKPPAGAGQSQGVTKTDRLIKAIEASEVAEIVIEEGDTKVTVRKAEAFAGVAAPAAPSAPACLEELMNRLTGIDITACPCCHRGKMRFLAEIPNY